MAVLHQIAVRYCDDAALSLEIAAPRCDRRNLRCGLEPQSSADAHILCKVRAKSSADAPFMCNSRALSSTDAANISADAAPSSKRAAWNHRSWSSEPGPRPRCGWTLLEVLGVVTMMGVLMSLSAPSFMRGLEQSRADIAGANLRAIWSAERVYWLDYHTYTADLAQLQSLGLLDPSIASATTVYVYAIQSATSSTFTATATRTGSTKWSGEFAIDETGVLSGVVQASGQPDIVPGFQ